MDCKEIKPINPKGNQSWIFTGRTDAEAETLILWPPDVKSQLVRNDPDAGKNRRQEEKGTTEDEMVGWHHRLNVYEFEQVPGDEGQGSLACCCPQVRRVQHDWVTEQQQTLQRHLQQNFRLPTKSCFKHFYSDIQIPNYNPGGKMPSTEHTVPLWRFSPLLDPWY